MANSIKYANKVKAKQKQSERTQEAEILALERNLKKQLFGSREKMKSVRIWRLRNKV